MSATATSPLEGRSFISVMAEVAELGFKLPMSKATMAYDSELPVFDNNSTFVTNILSGNKGNQNAPAAPDADPSHDKSAPTDSIATAPSEPDVPAVSTDVSPVDAIAGTDEKVPVEPDDETKRKASDIANDYNVTVEEVLLAAGVDAEDFGDDPDNLVVHENVVIDALGLVSKDEQERSRAEVIRTSPPMPGVREKLMKEFVDWSRAYRASRTLPADFRPGVVKRTGDTGDYVKYLVGSEADNQWATMKGIDFADAMQGLKSFVAPGPVTHAQKVKKAQRLKELLAARQPNCDIDGQPIEDYYPELSMVHSILRGGILKESGAKCNKGNGEFLIEYRRMHLLCRLVENVYVRLALDAATNPDLDIQAALIESVDTVLELAQEKKPGTTRVEVLETLQRMGQYRISLNENGTSSS